MSKLAVLFDSEKCKINYNRDNIQFCYQFGL